MQTPVNSVPFTITSPGHYFLTKDLFFNSTTGIAISINAGFVILDFAGHVLIGRLPPNNPPDSTGIEVGPNLANVTIKNGTITNFNIGIEIKLGSETSPSMGHVVEGMRIENITGLIADGIFCGGIGCLISNNFIANIKQFPGSFGIETAPFNQFTHNRVLNFEEGFSSKGENYFESNFVSNCLIGFSCNVDDKLRFNTTQNCATPFQGGVLITDDNN